MGQFLGLLTEAFMTSLFKTPKTPAVPEPIKPPTRDDAAIALEAEDKNRRRQGRASTILSQASSRTQSASGTSAKQLLGM